MYKNLSSTKTKQWCVLGTLNLLITNHDSLSTHKSKRNKWNWSSNFIESKSVLCIMKFKPFEVRSQFTPHITPTNIYIYIIKNLELKKTISWRILQVQILLLHGKKMNFMNEVHITNCCWSWSPFHIAKHFDFTTLKIESMS